MITVHLEGAEEIAEWRIQAIDGVNYSIRFIIQRKSYPSIYFRVICPNDGRWILKELVEMVLTTRKGNYEICIIQLATTRYRCQVMEEGRIQELLDMALNKVWCDDIFID